MKNNHWIYIVLVGIFTLFVGAVSVASAQPEVAQSFANSCPTILGTTPTPKPEIRNPKFETQPANSQPVNPPTQPTGDVLACIRSIEGGYTSVNPAGYYGAYQFAQGTWNSTASAAGRADLIGKNPAEVAPADQDAMALALIARRGLSPWPTPNRVCR